MQLLRKLFRNRLLSGRNHKIRGLSTAELIGIIIIVGILGALGGTYIGSLVGTANKNAIAQNVNSLNTVCASLLSGGVPVTDNNQVITAINGIAVNSTADVLNLLNGNSGNTVVLNGVTYKMTPPISSNAITAGTYVPTVQDDGNGNVTAITWTQGSANGTPINVP